MNFDAEIPQLSQRESDKERLLASFGMLIRKSIKCSAKGAGQFYLDISSLCMVSADENLLFPL